MSTPEIVRASFPSFSLKGRLALITGASDGIGKQIAIAFAGMGANAALISREPSRLEDTIAAIRNFGAETRGYAGDVTSIQSIQSVVDRVVSELGPVVILVNSAGSPLTKMAFDVTEEDWDRVIDTGLKGTYFTSVEVARYMAKQGYGKIINLSSTYSQSVAAGKSVYAISKAGISHLTRALAAEWASLGIRVNALAPTLTNTPTRQSIFQDPNRMESILSKIPMGRFATGEDITGAAIFLASEASDFITGQTIFVDGGWNAAR